MCRDTSSSASSGTLTDSGGASGNYRNRESCRFDIRSSGGDIELTFSSFSYESFYDYLYVYDGGTQIARLTGSSLPSSLRATSGTMTLYHRTDRSVTRAGFVASWSEVKAGCATETVADNFPGVSYSQSSGSQGWSTNWLEIGESDGPSAGIARVRRDLCTSGNCLRFGRPSGTGSASFSGRGVQREFDLSDATDPELSFVHRQGVNRGSSTIVLSVSDDGGSSWTELDRWTISSTNTSAVSESYALSSYASANTRIRFIASGTNAESGFYVDDVQVKYVSRSCGADVDHFEITHDGSGIHCVGERVRVIAADATGDPVTDYQGTIELDTGSGNGTWTSAGANAGTFTDATADDGLARYEFADADDGEANFILSYTQGTTPIDIEVVDVDDSSARDDDSEGALSWGASGFTVTANPLSNPPPGTINDPVPNQTAGTSFPLYLTAYGTTPTDPACGVIESYTGTQPISFWHVWSDPNSGTVRPTVGGSTIAGSEGAAAPQNVTFVNGQARVAAKYKDVGRIQIGLKDASVADPVGGIRGATNLFVVSPADFVITNVSRPDLTANPGVSTPTGDVFVAAGAPFRVTVDARDSEGSVTPNYGNEASAEGIVLRADTLVAPAGGRNGSANDGAIGNGTAFSVTGTAGTFLNTQASWDEAGAVTLQASVADGSYLGAGDVVGTSSGTVGRFRPDHFGVALNAPTFDTACGAGGFGYVGEPFGFMTGGRPVLTATAQAVGNTTTRNYTGGWMRLTNASLANRAYAAAAGTLDTTGLPATTADPTIVDNGDGTATLTFSAGSGLSFVRGVAPTAPFDADVALSIDVVDLDGAAYAANPARFGQAAAGLGISFDAGKEMRWGRVAFENAHGSELLPLAVPLRAESFLAAGYFAANLQDACTVLGVANLVRTPTPGSLASTPTFANTPLAAGDAGLALSAPGAGNQGTIDLRQDLSAAGDDLAWLRFDWDQDGAHDDDPTGRATFGVFSGDGAVIFQREVY